MATLIICYLCFWAFSMIIALVVLEVDIEDWKLGEYVNKEI